MQKDPHVPIVPTLVLLVLSAFVSACDDSPTRPGRTPPAGSAMPDRIELIAPDAVTPGASAPLTLIAYMPDGSTREVTPHADYHSSDTEVLTLVAPGRVRAQAPGEANILVAYGSLRTARLMFSMPTGTFRLMGRVTDDGTGIDGAEVRVVSGAGAGLRTTTGSSGQFRLYGVAGDTLVQVRKVDFLPASQAIDIGQNCSLDFELTPVTPAF
jgi:Carboxypeptidase regulatory-like domain